MHLTRLKRLYTKQEGMCYTHLNQVIKPPNCPE